MTQLNYKVSNTKVAMGDDYVDTLIKKIQAAALPSYGNSQKMVDPPLVAIRFGTEVFIKGVVIDAVSVTYELPLLENNKYGHVSVSFTINEVEPFNAEQVMQYGSYRGLDTTLDKNIWKV